MLEKKVRNQNRHLSDFYNASKPGSDDEELEGSEKKLVIRSIPL